MAGVTPRVNKAGEVKEEGGSVADDALTWIDKTVTKTRHSMWRTPRGMHYEADLPHDWQDTEVMYRVDTIVSGRVVGCYPDMGTVFMQSEMPAITEVTLPTEHGPWVRPNGWRVHMV